MLLLLLSPFSRVWLCVTPWTAAFQAPPSIGFSRQERLSYLKSKINGGHKDCPMPIRKHSTSLPSQGGMGMYNRIFQQTFPPTLKFQDIYYIHIVYKEGLPWWLNGKESTCNAGATGDAGSNPGSGRSPGGANDNPLQYSCLEKIPWTEEPGRLQAMGSQRVGHDWATEHTHLSM